MGAEVTLRRAAPEDLEFIRRAHRAAMRPHIERAWGLWDEEAQRKRFDASTDPAQHEIIERNGEPVGCQWVRPHADALELVRLYILPSAQGQGVGTQVVTDLCDRAERECLPVRLRVLRANQAKRLYQRAGFLVTGETETHFEMARPIP